jgi:hypothetical protein
MESPFHPFALVSEIPEIDITTLNIFKSFRIQISRFEILKKLISAK